MPVFEMTRRRLLAAVGAVVAMMPLSSGIAAPKHAPKTVSKTVRLQKWQCTNQDCDPYIYDPSLGDVNAIDPDNPIPPGVAFEDLPDDWICHICADPKSHFVPAGEWVEVEIEAG